MALPLISPEDDRFEGLEQIQQLTEGSADVLELLARTACHDLAVAEIEGFTAALESAKEAAATLPVSTEAA